MAEYSDLKVYKNIVLYTTGCPRCKTLEKRLNEVGVSYETNNSVDEMLALGMNNVPVLSVDGWRLDYKAAMDWVKKIENKQGGIE